MTLIEKATGNDRDALHEHFKREYLKQHRRASRCRTAPRLRPALPKHDNALKGASSEYIQKIERDTGIMIPEGQRNHLLKGIEIDVRNDVNYPDGDTWTVFD